MVNQCLATEIWFQEQLFILYQITQTEEELFVSEFGHVGNRERPTPLHYREGLGVGLLGVGLLGMGLLFQFPVLLLIFQHLVNLIHEDTVLPFGETPLIEDIDGESQNQQGQNGNSNTDCRHKTVLGTLLQDFTLLALCVVYRGKFCRLTTFLSYQSSIIDLCYLHSHTQG